MRSGIQDHAVLEVSVRTNFVVIKINEYTPLDSLNWRSYNVKCVSESHYGGICDILSKHFSRKVILFIVTLLNILYPNLLQFFSYSMAVLFPEAVKLMVMNYFSISHEEVCSNVYCVVICFVDHVTFNRQKK